MRVISYRQFPRILRFYFPERILTLNFIDTDAKTYRRINFWGCSGLPIRKKRLNSMTIDEELKTLTLCFEGESLFLYFDQLTESSIRAPDVPSLIKTDRGRYSRNIEVEKLQELLPELQTTLPSRFEFIVCIYEYLSYNDCFAIVRSSGRSFLLNFGNCDGVLCSSVGILRDIRVVIPDTASYEITLDAEISQKITCNNLAIYSLPHRFPHRFNRSGQRRKTFDAESYLLALRNPRRG